MLKKIGITNIHCIVQNIQFGNEKKKQKCQQVFIV